MKIRLSLIPMIVLAACATSLYATEEAKPAAPRGPSLAKRFEMADANKDGKLSKVEFQVFRASDKDYPRQRWGEAFDEERYDILTFEIFMKLDADSDGFVSKEEFAKYTTVASRKPPIKEEPKKKEEVKKEEPPKKEAPAKKAPPPKKAPAKRR